MDLKISNKNAVILASTKGLGKAIAKQLIQEKCNIAICSRSEDNVQTTIEEFKKIAPKVKVIGKAADMSNPKEIDGFFSYVSQELGNIDILVTNTGGPPSGKFETFTDGDWQNAFEQNFMSVVRTIRHALPSMKKQKSGKIIALTSIAVKAPVEDLILSNAMRAGVTGLIKTLATELAPYNISVNSVCPGYIRTERIDELADSIAKNKNTKPEEVIKSLEQKIPLKRLGSPEEFASLVSYLCSEQASYITGATYWMDGGLYPGLL